MMNTAAARVPRFPMAEPPERRSNDPRVVAGMTVADPAVLLEGPAVLPPVGAVGV